MSLIFLKIEIGSNLAGGVWHVQVALYLVQKLVTQLRSETAGADVCGRMLTYADVC
jgi:hypothetical protein